MGAKLAVFVVQAALTGCTSGRAADVTDNVRNSLKQAGLNRVTVSQDRKEGVVTLGGTVRMEADKERAEEAAQPAAGGQVVANEIAVVPDNNEASKVQAVDSDLDKGIEANLEAALRQAHIRGIQHETKNRVVTLKGEVTTPELRTHVERIADGVPNVQQVVNEIDTKYQRATNSSADRSEQPAKK